jgi:hypothetical protein
MIHKLARADFPAGHAVTTLAVAIYGNYGNINKNEWLGDNAVTTMTERRGVETQTARP